jgi:hypothetical protein
MSLRVGVDDLRVTAGRWGALAGDLNAQAPYGVGPSCQASAAAVNAGYADIKAATAALAARIRAGAAKVAIADTGYIDNEVRSARMLAEVPGPVKRA